MAPTCGVEQPQVVGGASDKGKTERKLVDQNQFIFGHIIDQFTCLFPSLNSVLKLETVMKPSFVYFLSFSPPPRSQVPRMLLGIRK